MKSLFLNNALDYILATDKKCSIFDDEGDETTLFNGMQIKLLAVDDSFAYFVFEGNESKLYYFPLSHQPMAKLLDKYEFESDITALTVTNDYIFIAHDKLISILPNSFGDTRITTSLIETKNDVTVMAASNRYFAFADGMMINIYQLIDNEFRKICVTDILTKHEVKYIGINEGYCVVMSEQQTMIKIFSITTREVTPIRLGYTWRTVHCVSLTNKYIVIVSDKTIHVFKYDMPGFHHMLPLHDTNALALRVIKNNAYILNENQKIMHFDLTVN